MRFLPSLELASSTRRPIIPGPGPSHPVGGVSEGLRFGALKSLGRPAIFLMARRWTLASAARVSATKVSLTTVLELLEQQQIGNDRYSSDIVPPCQGFV